MAPGKQRERRAVSGAAVSSDDEEAASQDATKNKGKYKPDRSKRNEKGAAQAAAEEVAALQHYNASAATESRPPSKHAPPAFLSQASTSSTATELQIVMEANRKESEKAQKLFDTANQNRRLAEENRKLKLQLQRVQREESTPPK